MKKKFIVSIFFVFSFFLLYATDNILTVMSFNIQSYGPNSHSGRHRPNDDRWVSQIAQVIKDSEADIILLQEVWMNDTSFVKKEVFFDKLLLQLSEIKNNIWNYKTSYEYDCCSQSNMHNAIVYNTKKVNFIKDIGKEEFFNSHNIKYKFQNNNIQVLEFKFLGRNFIVINTHLPAPGRIERKSELETLGSIYNNEFKRKFPIIIGGDFNTSRRSLIRESKFGDGKAIIDGNINFFVDLQGQNTTLNINNTENIGLAHDYDHIIVCSLKVNEMMHPVFFKRSSGKKVYKTPIRIKTAKEVYTYSSSYMYSQQLSDHLPIVMKIDFSNDLK